MADKCWHPVLIHVPEAVGAWNPEKRDFSKTVPRAYICDVCGHRTQARVFRDGNRYWRYPGGSRERPTDGRVPAPGDQTGSTDAPTKEGKRP